jgi:LmbE family N-acetylglucosaminyl deacetylase
MEGRSVMSTDLSLLGLFAHPDDEQLMSGAYARYAIEGIRTGLICATRGECGEIADPALATPETLGQVREAELRAACAVIGVKYLYFLDYRDSGMIGTPQNEDDRCFMLSNEEEALGRIVKIARDFRPTVMVTFDPTGGYGHPDHLTMSRLATLAFSAAADPGAYPGSGEPWQAARLFYVGFPRSALRMIGELMESSDMATGFRGVDMEMMGIPDELISTALDVSEWVAIKEHSMNQHRTQLNPNSPLARTPAEAVREWRSKESYQLVAGATLPEGAEDLFAGIRET